MMPLRSLSWTRPFGLACALLLCHCNAKDTEKSPAPSASAPAAAPQASPRSGSPPLVSTHDQPATAPTAAPPGAAAPPGPPFAALGGRPSPHGELHWDTPPGWSQEKPMTPMRIAQYKVPATGGDGEAGECVVFYFGPGQGGDAASNAARWSSQFSKPQGGPAQSRVTETKVGDRVVTRVEVEGTYRPGQISFGGEAPPPRPGYMLLGAIVPGGDANWFFRCTGPEATMLSNRAAFDGLLASIR